jgi:hypothetical protein
MWEHTFGPPLSLAGSFITRKDWTRMGMFARVEYTSLLFKTVNNGANKSLQILAPFLSGKVASSINSFENQRN